MSLREMLIRNDMPKEEKDEVSDMIVSIEKHQMEVEK